MANVTMLTIFLLLFFSTVTDAAKKRNKDKIIIHVPHKIHKHHHTHTKYKLITIPPKKEPSTVILLKEPVQPIVKEVPTVHTQIQIDSKPKVAFRVPEVISPPHQVSAQLFLQGVLDHQSQNSGHTDEEEYSENPRDQKPLESNSDQKSEKNSAYNPVILLSLDNLIHDLPLKPTAKQPPKPPKYVKNSGIKHSYKSYPPKRQHQPFVHSRRSHINNPNTFTPIVLSSKVPLQDSVAFTTSQVHKAVIPGPKAASYRVKEENEEREVIHPGNVIKLNSVLVPSLKSTVKGKTQVPLKANHQVKNLNSIPSDDYEYEHVGYLLVDGNSRKGVGKH